MPVHRPAGASRASPPTSPGRSSRRATARRPGASGRRPPFAPPSSGRWPPSGRGRARWSRHRRPPPAARSRRSRCGRRPSTPAAWASSTRRAQLLVGVGGAPDSTSLEACLFSKLSMYTLTTSAPSSHERAHLPRTSTGPSASYEIGGRVVWASSPRGRTRPWPSPAGSRRGCADPAPAPSPPRPAGRRRRGPPLVPQVTNGGDAGLERSRRALSVAWMARSSGVSRRIWSS